MRYSDILLEIPELIDATDFQLMDREVNRQLARRLLAATNKDVIREDEDNLLFRTGGDNGSIALVNKHDERVTYWVRFETIKARFTGVTTVTQVGLWRDAAAPETIGITSEIFFEYLLGHWDAIMSDRMQTDAGRDFWIRQMSSATVRGLRVGLADLSSKKIDWWDGSGIRNWIEQRREAWGRPTTPLKPGPYQSLRFVIAR